MATPIDQAAGPSRPGTTFTQEGELRLPASMIGRCRRAVWYEAAGAPPSNPPNNATMTALEMANALKPALVNALNRTGWQISTGNDPDRSARPVAIAKNITANAKPDLAYRTPEADQAEDEGDPTGPAQVIVLRSLSDRNFAKWQTQGAELTHPEAVLQAAASSFAQFAEPRPVIFLAMNTADRNTDYEVIPGHRVAQALEQVISWTSSLADHLQENGPDPARLPDRDYQANQWQCRNCQFFDRCQPEEPPPPAEPDPEDQPLPEEVLTVSAAQAQQALNSYENLQPRIKDLEDAKATALQTMLAFLNQQDLKEIKMSGASAQRKLKVINATNNKVDQKKLNQLLDPETRRKIYSTTEYSYLRVF